MQAEHPMWITKAHSGNVWNLWGTQVAAMVLSWSKTSTSETTELSPVTPRTHLTLLAVPLAFDCLCLRRVTDHIKHFCFYSLIKMVLKKQKWLLCRETCCTRKPFVFLSCCSYYQDMLFAFRLILFQGGMHNLGDHMAGDESLLLMEAQNNSKTERPEWFPCVVVHSFLRVQFPWKIAIVESKCLTQSLIHQINAFCTGVFDFPLFPF